MQLSEKITTPEDLLKVDDITHSAFMKECENLYGPLSEDTFWKYREYLRSTYVYTPINIKGKPFHFVHLNKDDPNLIAFTSNDKVGKKDGKTFIKPGKYLAQYSDLDNEQIKNVVTNYKHKFVPPKIFYAESADDVVRIYEEGPNSCMRGKGWETENHPTRIYFGPDTKLAYIKNKQGTGISSRCLVRTDKTPNEYTTIYGDKALMEKAFKAANIVVAKEGTKGCRFPLLWTKGNKDKKLLMPYIDGGQNNAYISKKRDEREFMVIGKLPTTDSEMYWRLSATPTGGYQQIPDIMECGKCGELEFEEKIVTVNGSSYCEKCSEKLDTITVNEGFKDLEQRITLEYAQQRKSHYFEVNSSWYTRNGLLEIGKFYNRNTGEIISLEDTGICSKSGDRYIKDDLLIFNTIQHGTQYFQRRNKDNLTDDGIHINPETYEFYSLRLAKKLISEGNTTLKPVRDYLNEKIEELKAVKSPEIEGSDYIPHIVNRMTVTEGIKEFLKLYLVYVNGDSSYL